MYVKWFPVDIPIHEPWVHKRGSSNFLWCLFYFSLFVCLFVFLLSFMFFFGPLQMNALQSVSVACAAISAITVYHYLVALSKLMVLDYFLTANRGFPNKDPYFFDSEIIFTAKQKSMVAVSSLIIICSITEIILAMAAIRSSNITGQSSREQQVREADDYQILASKQTRYFCVINLNHFDDQSVSQSVIWPVSQFSSNLFVWAISH